MSTVADILSLTTYRINDDANLYALVNLAIKTISRRLYVLRSSLILNEFEVSVFAEDTYTADTIAFVESDPDTITDSASQFVAEGFQVDMPVTTDHASNDGIYRLTAVAVGALTVEGATGVLTAAAEGSDVTVTSLATFGYLPSDFWAMGDDKPYIDGETWELEPLPSQLVGIGFSSASEPRYYKVKGTRLYVYPETNADITVKADYFQKPTAVAATTDTVPFNGLFDEVIAEYLVRFYSSGSQSAEGMVTLRSFVESEVDILVPGRDREAPKRMPTGGINWNDL